MTQEHYNLGKIRVGFKSNWMQDIFLRKVAEGLELKFVFVKNVEEIKPQQ